MDQITFYLTAHAAMALALVALGIRRFAQKDAGLAEWANDSLYVGLVFALALTTFLPMLA